LAAKMPRLARCVFSLIQMVLLFQMGLHSLPMLTVCFAIITSLSKNLMYFYPQAPSDIPVFANFLVNEGIDSTSFIADI
jgi:hypothetical protein